MKFSIKTILWNMTPRSVVEPTYNSLVWTTVCGQYRIEYYSDSGLFTAKRVSPVQGQASSFNWITISQGQTTLEAAMDDVNVYHCAANNLILIK